MQKQQIQWSSKYFGGLKTLTNFHATWKTTSFSGWWTVPNYMPYLCLISQNSSFEVFLKNVAGLLAVTASTTKYFLLCTELLTVLTTPKTIERSANKEAKDLTEQDIDCGFGVLKVAVSDNAACFMSMLLVKYMMSPDTVRKSRLVFVPILNGRARRIVGTIKMLIRRTFAGIKLVGQCSSLDFVCNLSAYIAKGFLFVLSYCYIVYLFYFL